MTDKLNGICPTCDGHRRQGYYEGDNGELFIRPCPTCQGTGKLKERPDIPAYISTVWHKEGDGIPHLKFKCPACGQRYKLKDIDEISEVNNG